MPIALGSCKVAMWLLLTLIAQLAKVLGPEVGSDEGGMNVEKPKVGSACSLVNTYPCI